MCKSSVHFRLGPSHFVCLATALLVVCAYLIPRVFIETRDYKFSSTISDMFFCLLLPLPFPASKKIVFLEYTVASENADCALLFDGFSL